MENLTFSIYKKWIEDYINYQDIREINFQNDVVNVKYKIRM